MTSDISAQYSFAIENGEPFLRLDLMWRNPADVSDFDDALFTPYVSFLQPSSLPFEEEEKLREWFRDRPAVPFSIRTQVSRVFRDENPQRLLVGLKVSRGSSESMIDATPRDVPDFASSFEAAFRDETQVWKIAASEDEVWVMRFGRLTAGETPSFFVLPPLSQRAWSQSDIPIDFNDPTSTMAFVNVDPERWMLQFLRDTRTVPEGAVTPALRQTWDRIEEHLAFRAVALDDKQPRTDPTSARERLRAAIHADVSAYANFAVVELPVDGGLTTERAQLHGTVGSAEGVINIHQQQAELVFVVNSSNPRPVISTDVSFEAKSVANLKFLVPDDPCLRMPIAKPFAVRGVRRTRSAPDLRFQEARPSFDEPKMIDEVLSWTYRCELSYDQNLNDVAVFDCTPDRPPEPTTNDDVFRALAQHMVVFPQIREDVKALTDMSERLLAALQSTPTPPPIDGGGPFRVAMRNEDIDGVGHIRLLSPPPDPIPSVSVAGTTTEPTSTPGLYRFRREDGQLMATDDLLAESARSLNIPMHLDSQTDVRMTVRIDRNADVDSLLVRGDLMSFPLLVPSLDTGTAIAIGGSRAPLARHLAEPFTRLLRRPFRIECRYSAGMSEIPVLLVQWTEAAEDPTPFVNEIAAGVEAFMRSAEVSPEGTLTFDVTLLAETAALLRTRLVLNVADIER